MAALLSSRLRFAVLALLPALVGLLLRLIYGSDDTVSIPFDQALKARMERDAADVAVIGNSMVSQRLDLKLLRKQAKPLKVSTISIGGSGSLHWYCALKNLFATNPKPPKLVCLVFRDFDFTNIGMDFTGSQVARLRPLMMPEDDALLKMAQSNGSVTGWKRWINETFVAPNRLAERHATNASDLVGRFSGVEGDVVLEKANLLFSPENLRGNAMDAGGEANAALVSSELRFSTGDDENFLGRFVQLAREKGMKLVFYRVKRRPDDANGITRHQPPGMKTYMKQFLAWAAENGCGFIDETEDPRITEPMFQDGDHLAASHYAENTEWFLARLRPFLPTSAPAVP